MLLKKAMRAIWSNKRSYLACIFLISIGVLMFTALNTAGESLAASADRFYSDYRLSDIFAKVDGIPISYMERFTEIEGLEAAEARYVLDVQAEVPNADETVTLRLFAFDMVEASLNRLLVEGSAWSDDNDILLNPAFYAAGGLEIGDEITVIHRGQTTTFTVCGTALSPENIYVTKSAADMLPDNVGFGVGYVSADVMISLADTAGRGNDLVFKLAEGYSYSDVKIPLEDMLAPFGLKELIEKKDQLSYSFVDLELTSILSMASSLPVVFILIAAVVLYLMMKRVIEQERTQIGVLRAFGYSRTQIMAHYMSYGAVTGIAGGLAGCVMGYYMAEFYFRMFMEYFQMPAISGSFNPRYYAVGFLLAVFGGLLGSFMGALKSLRLIPAEAMRPESPPPIKFDPVSRIKVFRYILTSRGSMALRSIARNRARSVFVIVGVMFSFGLITMSGSFNRLVDKMMYSQYTLIQRYGVKLPLNTPLPYDLAVESAYALEAVTLAEGILEMPVELKHRHLREGSLLTGVKADSALYKVCDTNKMIVYPPREDSLIITNGIANKLAVSAGDTVYVSSPLLDEDVPILISRVIEQNMGSGCYMEIGALSELLELPVIASSIVLNTDDLPYLKDQMKNSLNIATVEDKDGTLKKLQDMMGIYSSVYVILQVMSALVGFAIIYNTSTISLSERKREYATLRVIGLTVDEVAGLMNFEYWVLGAAGMLVGIPFALYLNAAMNAMMDTTVFSMASSLPLPAYLTRMVGSAVAIVLSGWSAKRKIRQFDMVEVLKERD